MPANTGDPYRGDLQRDQLFVRIFTVDAITIDHHWNSPDVCSGYWRLYQNDHAGASLELPEGHRYALPPDRLHLVPAWVRFSCHNEKPLTHRFVHFDLIGVTATTVRRVFTKPLSLPKNRHLEGLAGTLSADGQEDEVICRAKAVVYGAMAVVMADLPGGGTTPLAEPGPVAAAVRYIDDHLGGRIRNRDLATRCHLSEDHFGRVFRDRIGMTPAQYVIERRIAAATQELTFTPDSIEQIAERLGFANRYHLTRLFTRRMGVPPATYRHREAV